MAQVEAVQEQQIPTINIIDNNRSLIGPPDDEPSGGGKCGGGMPGMGGGGMQGMGGGGMQGMGRMPGMMPGMGGRGMMGMNMGMNGMMPNLSTGLLGSNLAMQRAMTMMRTVGARAGMPGMGMGMPTMGAAGQGGAKPMPAAGGIGSMFAQTRSEAALKDQDDGANEAE